VSRSGKIVLVFAAVLGAAACVFLVTVLVVRGLGQASLWAGVVAALAGVVAVCTAVWPLVFRPSKALLPPELQVPEWVVGRPAEMAAVAGVGHASYLQVLGGAEGI
jgi:hypothetical protein